MGELAFISVVFLIVLIVGFGTVKITGGRIRRK